MITINNKKGVSEIVSTVLIIVIAITAVAIIAAFVIPMVKDNLNVNAACSIAQKDLSMGESYTCVAADKASANVQLKRGTADYELSAVDFIIKKAGNSKTISITTGLPTKANEAVVLSVSEDDYDFTDAETIEAAPKLKIGNKIETCGVVGSVKLVTCAA